LPSLRFRNPEENHVKIASGRKSYPDIKKAFLETMFFSNKRFFLHKLEIKGNIIPTTIDYQNEGFWKEIDKRDAYDWFFSEDFAPNTEDLKEVLEKIKLNFVKKFPLKINQLKDFHRFCHGSELLKHHIQLDTVCTISFRYPLFFGHPKINHISGYVFCFWTRRSSFDLICKKSLWGIRPNSAPVLIFLRSKWAG
jgi:hypothetical protein